MLTAAMFAVLPISQTCFHVLQQEKLKITLQQSANGV
jgi:hypothetical protein